MPIYERFGKFVLIARAMSAAAIVESAQEWTDITRKDGTDVQVSIGGPACIGP